MKKLFLLSVLLIILFSCKKKDACDGNGTIVCINSSQDSKMGVLVYGHYKTFLTPGQSESIAISKGTHYYSFYYKDGAYYQVFCSGTINISECQELTVSCNGTP